jgi:hypothetical protein
MALRRASCQCGCTLREYYEEFAGLPADNPLAGVGAAMVELLPHLDRVCEGTGVFGVTWHDALHLHRNDESKGPAAVIIRATPEGEIQVAYRMPAAEAPWTDALVQGVAPSPEIAARMIAVAIERSGAWRA